MNRTFDRRLITLAVAFPVVMALAGLFLGSRTSADGVNDTVQAVLKIDDEFNKALVTKDRAAMDRLLADDLSWIARGDRLNKAQVMADVLSENLHFKSLTHDSLVTKVFGNTVIVTGHSTSVLDYKGKPYTSPRLFTNVYMNLNGKWQLVAHHVSELNPEKK